ncbi:MAG: hypothetical protein Q4B43_06725 [Bacteroidota bacterium]|nr:hypothetical protein [Bacteroidota bacterium]
MKRILFSLLAMVLLVGCSKDDAPAVVTEQYVQYMTLLKGNESNFYSVDESEKRLVFTNSESWNEFVSLTESSSLSSIEIDFNQFTVIALIEELQGNQSTLEVTTIVDNGTRLEVVSKRLNTFLNATSRPYHIVRIPKTTKPVVFKPTYVTTNL